MLWTGWDGWFSGWDSIYRAPYSVDKGTSYQELELHINSEDPVCQWKKIWIKFCPKFDYWDWSSLPPSPNDNFRRPWSGPIWRIKYARSSSFDKMHEGLWNKAQPINTGSFPLSRGASWLQRYWHEKELQLMHDSPPLIGCPNPHACALPMHHTMVQMQRILMQKALCHLIPVHLAIYRQTTPVIKVRIINISNSK